MPRCRKHVQLSAPGSRPALSCREFRNSAGRAPLLSNPHRPAFAGSPLRRLPLLLSINCVSVLLSRELWSRWRASRNCAAPPALRDKRAQVFTASGKSSCKPISVISQETPVRRLNSSACHCKAGPNPRSSNNDGLSSSVMLRTVRTVRSARSRARARLSRTSGNRVFAIVCACMISRF